MKCPICGNDVSGPATNSIDPVIRLRVHLFDHHKHVWNNFYGRFKHLGSVDDRFKKMNRLIENTPPDILIMMELQ